MNVLAIDQGTSATKAVVVSAQGRVLGESVIAVRPTARTGGVVEQDAQEVLDSVVAAGRSAVRAAGTEVGAVGVANQGETVLRWEPGSGRPLGPALSWQDRRAVEVTRDLEWAADRLRELTGLPLDPYFAAAKMAWLRRHSGGEGVISTIDAWLNFRLTGSFVTDAATASRTQLLDLDSTEWSAEACAVFGLDPEEQPRVADCNAGIGDTAAFGRAVPVTGLAVDQHAALFAESCFAAGEAKCTYGTGAFILATTGTTALRSRSRLAACVAWRLSGQATYCLDGQVYAAGSAISWLRRLRLIGDASDLDRLGPLTGHGDSVVFVPSLAGMGAPFWAPQARGGWVGLSLATRREDLVAAVAWGIAAHVAWVVRAIEEDMGRPLTRLRADGGLSRSDALMQAQADLLQLRVERPLTRRRWVWPR